MSKDGEPRKQAEEIQRHSRSHTAGLKRVPPSLVEKTWVQILMPLQTGCETPLGPTGSPGASLPHVENGRVTSPRWAA